MPRLLHLMSALLVATPALAAVPTLSAVEVQEGEPFTVKCIMTLCQDVIVHALDGRMPGYRLTMTSSMRGDFGVQPHGVRSTDQDPPTEPNWSLGGWGFDPGLRQTYGRPLPVYSAETLVFHFAGISGDVGGLVNGTVTRSTDWVSPDIEMRTHAMKEPEVVAQVAKVTSTPSTPAGPVIPKATSEP
ncbi:MAG: hypothetical protein LC620_08440, partial [Halobacteriales archaeon]|nr:hypothetical protein [Halobacteriales archaeon]